MLVNNATAFESVIYLSHMPSHTLKNRIRTLLRMCYECKYSLEQGLVQSDALVVPALHYPTYW